MSEYLHWQQAQLASAFPAILWEGAPPAGKATLPHYLPLASLTLHSQEPRPSPTGFQLHWVTLKLYIMAASSPLNPTAAPEELVGPLLQWLQAGLPTPEMPNFTMGQLVVGMLESQPAPAGAYACVLTLHRLIQTRHLLYT